MVTSLLALADETAFTKAFRSCTPFTDSGKVTTGGMDVTSSKKIVGWQGDRCVYREDINMMDINSTITCKFTKSQINELASVIEAYELVQQYSDSTPDCLLICLTLKKHRKIRFPKPGANTFRTALSAQLLLTSRNNNEKLRYNKN